MAKKLKIFIILMLSLITAIGLLLIWVNYGLNQESNVRSARPVIALGILKGRAFNQKDRYATKTFLGMDVCEEEFWTKYCVALKIKQSQFDAVGYDKVKSFVNSPCMVFFDNEVLRALKKHAGFYDEVMGNWGRWCLEDKDSLKKHNTVIKTTNENGVIINKYIF